MVLKYLELLTSQELLLSIHDYLLQSFQHCFQLIIFLITVIGIILEYHRIYYCIYDGIHQL